MLLETIPKVVFQLGQELDSSAAVDMLNAVPYVNYLATATGKTLDFVSTHMLDPVNGHRIGADTIVIVTSATVSQEGLAVVNSSSMNLRNTGARVIVIESGDNSVQFEEETLLIASQPSDVYALSALEAAIQQGQSYFETDFMQQYFCVLNFSSSSAPTPSPSPSLSLSATPSPSSVYSSSSSAFISSSIVAEQRLSTSSFLQLSSTVQPSSTLISTSTPVAHPSPTPLTYCSFLTTDVVFVISASGSTGGAIFDRFVSMAEHIISLLPAGTGSVRYEMMLPREPDLLFIYFFP